jgi:hypothetical protein
MTTENSIDSFSLRSRFASLWRAAKWINRHGTSAALLLLLVGGCAYAHLVAATKADLLREVAMNMDPASLRRGAGIEFIHNHWWFVLPYLAVFGGSVVWLEARNAPRWAVWTVFMVLAVPCFMYAWACLDWALMGFFVTM